MCDGPLRKEGVEGDYVEVSCDPEGENLENAIEAGKTRGGGAGAGGRIGGNGAIRYD